jgi:hypothetical protein
MRVVVIAQRWKSLREKWVKLLFKNEYIQGDKYERWDRPNHFLDEVELFLSLQIFDQCPSRDDFSATSKLFTDAHHYVQLIIEEVHQLVGCIPELTSFFCWS